MMWWPKISYVVVWCVLLSHATGCLRPEETCQSASDCFGAEACVDGECIAQLAIEDMSTSPDRGGCAGPECEQSDAGTRDMGAPDDIPPDARAFYGELSPAQIVSSEVAVSARYSDFDNGACRFALASDGAPWVAFTEQPSADLNQVALFRRDPSLSLWEEHLVSEPSGFFGPIDLEAARDGRVALCVYEEFASRLDVHELDMSGDLGRWSVSLSMTEEMQCQVASGSLGQAVLYKERTGDGSRSALMLARRSEPDLIPSTVHLDAAAHDAAWTLDLFLDAQDVLVAMYHGMFGGRAALRYGEELDEGWSFEPIETAFTSIQRDGAAALGPDGLLHVVTLEDAVSQGEQLTFLTYLHPEDEALDLVLESFYIAPGMTDLAVDASGRPHLVFSDGQAHWYATVIDRTWRVLAFPELTDAFSSCLRVRADASGRAHILMDTSGWNSNPTGLDAVDLVYRVVDVQGNE